MPAFPMTFATMATDLDGHALRFSRCGSVGNATLIGIFRNVLNVLRTASEIKPPSVCHERIHILIVNLEREGVHPEVKVG